MSSGVNIGDSIYQLFVIILLVLFIVLVVSLIRSFFKRNKQIDNIEKTLDEINDKLKSDNK